MRTEPRKGDDAVVHTDRPELEKYGVSYLGKTGQILAVRDDAVLLKFKGHSGPVSFPRDFVAVRINQ